MIASRYGSLVLLLALSQIMAGQLRLLVQGATSVPVSIKQKDNFVEAMSIDLFAANVANYGWPVPKPEQMSSTFGPRYKWSESRDDYHQGIDFYDVDNTDIYSIGAGTVNGVFLDGSSTYPNGGNVIVVRHDLSPRIWVHGVECRYLYSHYLHLNAMLKVVGDVVAKGEKIGEMGQTGNTVFTHLHFELRIGTKCSLPFQLANPTSGCSVGFGYMPHIHPLLFLPRDLPWQGTHIFDRGFVNFTKNMINDGTTSELHMQMHRRSLGLNRIRFVTGGRRLLDYVQYTGFDTTSYSELDNLDLGWGTLDPDQFFSTSSIYGVKVRANNPHDMEVMEFVDIFGQGVRVRFTPQEFDGEQNLLMPVYHYDPAKWTEIRSGLAQGDVIIINPSGSGPGGYNSALDNELELARALDVFVIGYIDTQSGGKSLSTLKSEMDLYRSQYSNISGFFFDKASLTDAQFQTLNDACAYAQSFSTRFNGALRPYFTVLGADAPPSEAATKEEYMLVSDVVTLTASSGGTSAQDTRQAPYSWVLPEWITEWDADHFGVQFHSAASPNPKQSSSGDIDGLIKYTKQHNIKYVFISDQVGASASQLNNPTWFKTEVADKIHQPSLKRRGITLKLFSASQGSFNFLANSVPQFHEILGDYEKEKRLLTYLQYYNFNALVIADIANVASAASGKRSQLERFMVRARHAGIGRIEAAVESAADCNELASYQGSASLGGEDSKFDGQIVFGQANIGPLTSAMVGNSPHSRFSKPFDYAAVPESHLVTPAALTLWSGMGVENFFFDTFKHDPSLHWGVSSARVGYLIGLMDYQLSFNVVFSAEGTTWKDSSSYLGDWIWNWISSSSSSSALNSIEDTYTTSFHSAYSTKVDQGLFGGFQYFDYTFLALHMPWPGSNTMTQEKSESKGESTDGPSSPASTLTSSPMTTSPPPTAGSATPTGNSGSPTSPPPSTGAIPLSPVAPTPTSTPLPLGGLDLWGSGDEVDTTTAVDDTGKTGEDNTPPQANRGIFVNTDGSTNALSIVVVLCVLAVVVNAVVFGSYRLYRHLRQREKKRSTKGVGKAKSFEEPSNTSATPPSSSHSLDKPTEEEV